MKKEKEFGKQEIDRCPVCLSLFRGMSGLNTDEYTQTNEVFFYEIQRHKPRPQFTISCVFVVDTSIR